MTEIRRTQPPAIAERAGAVIGNAIHVRPRALLIGALAIIAIGLALNWSWLVAVGIAPALLAIAPCAVMCALGLCMNMKGTSATETPRPQSEAAPGEHVLAGLASTGPMRADHVPGSTASCCGQAVSADEPEPPEERTPTHA